MFALIRFLNEFDETPYVVSAKSIKDFNPTDENDYDKNGVYSTYWEDKEKCENSGIYSAQILLLACEYHFTSY